MSLCMTVNRFENEIIAHEQRAIQTGKVLLYGSSFFTNWGYERAQEQWSEASSGVLQVVNHGFGGSTVDELLYYYSRMVKPYSPSMVVLRTGFNDVMMGLSPEQVWFLTERLLAWLKTDFPDAQIVLLENYDNRLPNDAQMEQIRSYNLHLRNFAEQTDRVYSLEMNHFVYERGSDIGIREKLRNVFVSDGIHLTDEAYTEVAQYIVQRIVALCQLETK